MKIIKMKIIKWISLIFVNIIFICMTNRYCPNPGVGWFVYMGLFVIGIVSFSVINNELEEHNGKN